MVLFSDEKIFGIEEKVNAQNDHMYGVVFEDIPENLRTAQRFQSKSSQMVWAGASFEAKFPRVFIEQGAKVDGEYYFHKILDGTVKTWVLSVMQDGNWTFQEDGAPVHTANVSQGFCDAEFPSFTTKDD